MASQPPCAPSSPKYPEEGGKTEPQECGVQPPLVPAPDGAHHPSKLPWAALVRAFGHFRVSMLETQQDQMLAPLDPLAVDQELPKKLSMPEKKFWGDQEPLSKVRTALWEGAVACFLHVGRARASKSNPDKPTWLLQELLRSPGASLLPEAHLVGKGSEVAAGEGKEGGGASHCHIWGIRAALAGEGGR